MEEGCATKDGSHISHHVVALFLCGTHGMRVFRPSLTGGSERSHVRSRAQVEKEEKR